jgi:hypothetical protein
MCRVKEQDRCTEEVEVLIFVGRGNPVLRDRTSPRIPICHSVYITYCNIQFLFRTRLGDRLFVKRLRELVQDGRHRFAVLERVPA